VINQVKTQSSLPMLRTPMIKTRYLQAGMLMVITASVFLGGCSGEKHSDLVAYVQKIKSKKARPIPPLPEIKPYDNFIYEKNDRRDPFAPFIEEIRSEQVKNDGLTPDINRKKEALEEFPLDSLKYVGTLEKKGIVWALISAPDNTVYRVQVGNHMGSNYGEILNISENEIALKEIIPNGATGGWMDRASSISMSD
jgi:type IV pilus assembly protein PilP